MGQGQPVDAGRVAAALGGRSVVLVGMMGAGKTSVGKRLAAKLGLPFVDADAEIEAGAQLTISEIFERFGEPYFREGERKVIARLLNGGPLVLATGGGAFMNATTRDNIAKHGVSIWLKPSFDILLARVRKKSNRPLLKTADPEQTLRRLLEERTPTYALADFTIESLDGSHDAVVDAILRRLDATLGKDVEPVQEARRKVEVPLGARAYSILIGPGLLDEAGAEIARIAPGAHCAIVTDAHVAPLYLDRLAASLRSSRVALDADRLPARRSHEVLCRIRPRLRRADRGAHRAAGRRHRAWRRRDRRSRRILRREPAPGRAPGPDPDHASRPGRFQRRRQDGDQFAARQEPRRRLSSTVAGAGRHSVPRHAERARISRRLRRSRQIRAHWRPRLFRVSGIRTGATRSPAVRRAPKRSRSAAPPRRGSSPPTRPSRASGRCSISAILSGMRSRG